MPPKPPSPAAQRRRIERLESEIAALRESNRRLHEVYSSLLSESVDYKIRARQAIQILQGTDE